MLKKFWPSFLMLALLVIYLTCIWIQIEIIYRPAPAPEAVNTSREEIDLGETQIIPDEIITQEEQP